MCPRLTTRTRAPRLRGRNRHRSEGGARRTIVGRLTCLSRRSSDCGRWAALKRDSDGELHDRYARLAWCAGSSADCP